VYLTLRSSSFIYGNLLLGLVLYTLMPPELKDTPEAPVEAKLKLEELGPMTTGEKVMLATMGVAVALWMLGPSIGISAVLAAMLGE
jgi:di/tricarboxylate transporter